MHDLPKLPIETILLLLYKNDYAFVDQIYILNAKEMILKNNIQMKTHLYFHFTNTFQIIINSPPYTKAPSLFNSISVAPTGKPVNYPPIIISTTVVHGSELLSDYQDR